ncbi:MAG: hypothetical protein KDB35_08375, partial [Acidimicrobiales bacterium]|nr:hypothetical protein [Acidimicrobiales bacterium]
MAAEPVELRQQPLEPPEVGLELAALRAGVDQGHVDRHQALVRPRRQHLEVPGPADVGRVELDHDLARR